MSNNRNVAFLNQVDISSPNKNLFPLDHEVKLTTDFGRIVPFFIAEAVPGDKWRLNTELFTRLAPMVFPVMHRMDATVHFFFVPHRLTFDGWPTFFTGGEKGDGKDEYGVTQVPPTWITGGDISIEKASVADYLGIPPGVVEGLALSAMPFRAYQKVCNEWYRNQNVIEPYTFLPSGGPVTATDFNDTHNVMRYKSWERDMFTGSLPWTQRGEVSVIGTGVIDYIPNSGASGIWKETDGTPPGTSGPIYVDGEGQTHLNTATGINLEYDPNGTLSVAPVTVNEFRHAIRVQELYELYARTGARYYEAILGEFGVRSPDARLQRPEYIGGGRTPILISEVLSTAQTDERVLGDFAGHGISSGSQNSGRYFATEFGYIIGLLSYAPCTGYTQGIERLWFKNDKFDYLRPKLSHLGERPVYNAEVYAMSDQTDPLGTFGYMPQYSEYRYITSRCAGEFRDTMLDWHLDRVFSSPPALNEDFVTCKPSETSRIFNVTDPDEDHLWVQAYNSVRVYRPLSLFGAPTI